MKYKTVSSCSIAVDFVDSAIYIYIYTYYKPITIAINKQISLKHIVYYLQTLWYTFAKEVYARVMFQVN